ncbi:unnamed protein product [Cylicocyclus nassatus]|uniref:Uncharacterized protein n=1 Tax=Cylicocyclus nassatus TaxID=53992 RepID=A0AA36M9F5_CYLNA|nr:unnamed protein product [Cylicocyclus nassatus]
MSKRRTVNLSNEEQWEIPKFLKFEGSRDRNGRYQHGDLSRRDENAVGIDSDDNGGCLVESGASGRRNG